ncbi:glutamate--cysteine ligase [Kitasatospora sp. NPDC094015]|uniref:carboxylate-amine ligase n=1 Tax=Kitasatospora sp. NPDC094015 TaxID=3155205 RepID=UPI00332A4CEB
MLTVGVEEEYLLLDPATGTPVARAARVRAAADGQPSLEDGEVQRELLQAQLEVATPVCHELKEVGDHLRRMRHALGEAALAKGCLLAATGAAPYLPAAPVPVTPSARYRAMQRDTGRLTDEQLITGMHVHVGVPDRATGVAVLNALRPWLPVLVALAANSPLWDGADTGFASWRTVVFGRWPVSGPPPEFTGSADYDRRIQGLVAAGLIRDTRQLYWLARLSERYPTVELRAPDVQLDVDEAVMLAGLVRNLALHAVRERQAGRWSAAPEPEVLRGAVWHAARYGCAGELFDPLGGRLRAAGDVVADLVGLLGPELEESGDRPAVVPVLERVLREGGGAARQRRALAGSGRPGLLRLITEGEPAG